MNDKELLKGCIDIILLSIISKHKSIYGYDIAKKIVEISNNEFQLKDGTLYLALKRLEANNCLSTKWVVADNNMRRKYYEITNIGIEYLNKKLTALNNIHSLINKISKGDDYIG